MNIHEAIEWSITYEFACKCTFNIDFILKKYMLLSKNDVFMRKMYIVYARSQKN